MGIINRAIRNISRRKIRALLVIIALGFSMAIMISIPAGVMANQQEANSLAENLSNTITQTGQSINDTLSQIDCSLSPDFAGFGFQRSNASDSLSPGQFGQGMTPPDDFVFDPSQFGGGMGSGRGQFGGGALGGGEANPMNESLYTDINTNIDGVAAVAPILQASEGSNETLSFMGRSFTRQITEYTIEGVSLTSELIGNYSVLPTNITAGRNLQVDDSGVVLLSENNSAYFDAGVGDTISILDHDFTVIGIHGVSSVADTLTLFMNLSDAQTITNNTGYITSIRVFTENSEIVSQVSSSISSLHSELTITTGQERLSQLQALQSTYNAALESSEASINTTQTTALQEIIVVIAATSLIVLFVMLYTVRERTKEIGTLKAIGFSNSTVMGQFMLEGVLLSAIAGAVGIAIGVVAAPTLSALLLPSVNALGGTGGVFVSVGSVAQTTEAVSISLELILLAFGASLLLGTLGSLYPAWRAAKIRPAEAMKYE